MGGVNEVVFEVDCQNVSLSEPEARILGERLRGFAAGNFTGDVDLLEAYGTDREGSNARSLSPTRSRTC